MFNKQPQPKSPWFSQSLNKSLLQKTKGLEAIIIVIFLGVLYTGVNLAKTKIPSPQIVEETLLMDSEKYTSYSDQNLKKAKNKGVTVLFFAATNWCQTCSALDKEISQNLNKIPNDITVLKVDYDNDKEMNNKYSVTTQHTLVLLDKNGDEIKRWVGGNLETLLLKLQES